MAHTLRPEHTGSDSANRDALALSPIDASTARDDSQERSKMSITTTTEQAAQSLQDISRVSTEAGRDSRDRSYPALLRIGPLSGLAALFLALVLLFASFAVLMISDGQETDKWHEPWVPTVWLAIFTALSNKLIAFAAVQGVVISWWRKAVKGATLGQLHTDWSYGLHAWKALFAGRGFNILALACLCATFVAIDGPLLQRASSIHLGVPQKPVNLSVSITPELPSYWTGYWAFNSTGYTLVGSSAAFHPVVEDLLQSKTISGIGGCPDSCSATVLAPALATYGCKTEVTYRNFSVPLHDKVDKAYVNALRYSLRPVAPPSRTVYAVFPYIAEDSPPDIEWSVLETAISDEKIAKTCTGSVNYTRCALVSAIGEYTIHINDGVVTFPDPGALSSPKIVSIANNTGITPEVVARKGLLTKDGYVRTTLSGIIDVATEKWFSLNGLLPPNSGGTNALPDRQNVLETALSPWAAMQLITNWERFNRGADCAPSWVDPRDQIMAWLNEVMFRTGVYTAQTLSQEELQAIGLDEGVTSQHTVIGHRTKPVNFYKSNMSYFAGAAVAQLFSMVIILYLFYGWWSLGWRSGSVSFSPLELAKAFDAPLLRDVPSDLNGAKIAKLDGERYVQYGILYRGGVTDAEKGLNGTTEKMAFEQVENVRRLESGQSWSEWKEFLSSLRSGSK